MSFSIGLLRPVSETGLRFVRWPLNSAASRRLQRQNQIARTGNKILEAIHQFVVHYSKRNNLLTYAIRHLMENQSRRVNEFKSRLTGLLHPDWLPPERQKRMIRSYLQRLKTKILPERQELVSHWPMTASGNIQTF
jgi:hypothetical protein